MSSNSSNTPEEVMPKRPLWPRVGYAIGLPLWVFAGFMLAQLVVVAVLYGLQQGGLSFDTINTAVFNSVGSAVIYAVAITIVLGFPVLVKRGTLSKETLGIHRWPRWIDIFSVPVAMVAYLILTSIVVAVATQALPFVDYEQAQETGFNGLSSQIEYIVAFLSLVVIAPIAEEVLFRGYLFGKLRKRLPLWIAIGITSLLFAIVHFQWNVGIDVFVLSIVLCILRVQTKGLWAPILLHMLKNGTAYYFLFVNPTLLSTLGG